MSTLGVWATRNSGDTEMLGGGGGGAGGGGGDPGGLGLGLGLGLTLALALTLTLALALALTLTLTLTLTTGSRPVTLLGARRRRPSKKLEAELRELEAKGVMAKGTARVLSQSVSPSLPDS